MPDLDENKVIVVDDGLVSGFSKLTTLKAFNQRGVKEAEVSVPIAPGRAINLTRTRARWRVMDRRMIGALAIVFIVFALASTYLLLWQAPQSVVKPPTTEDKARVELPEPRYDSDTSVEEALLARRSIRKYSGEPLTLQEVSQLLWSAQGITDPRGFRTAPSAGALYPLEVYVVVGDVGNLREGVYRYNTHEHVLVKVLDGDKRAELSEAAVGQDWVKDAAVDIVITAVYERTTAKYGDRGVRYVHMEVGHATQNLCLQATALDLGIVTVGAFHDDKVKELLDLPENEQPLYIIPVGKRSL